MGVPESLCGSSVNGDLFDVMGSVNWWGVSSLESPEHGTADDHRIWIVSLYFAMLKGQRRSFRHPFAKPLGSGA